MTVTFPVSGVETWLFLPPLVMFVISLFASTGGVSGAFILLPFQMSVLGYTAPGVSATNFVYNIVSIPSGVYRYIRDGKMSWHLFTLLTLPTLPGLMVGYYMRVAWLPEPGIFKYFAGAVLGYLGLHMFWSLRKERAGKGKPVPPSGRITGGSMGLKITTIQFGDEEYSFSSLAVILPSIIVGVVGGAYGIGGGAIMAPFCISVLNLPPYVVAGATLFSTWVMSVVAALFYAFLVIGDGSINTSPDWLLGTLFGLGGLAGIYLGARLQKYVPVFWIKLILAVAVTLIAVKYIVL